jgi:hypothetical protein
MKMNPVSLSVVLGVGVLAGWYLSAQTRISGKNKNGVSTALEVMLDDTNDVIKNIKDSVLKELSVLNVTIEKIERRELAEIIENILKDISGIRDILSPLQIQTLSQNIAKELQFQRTKLTKLIE